MFNTDRCLGATYYLTIFSQYSLYSMRTYAS